MGTRVKDWIPATFAFAASITLPWALAAKEYSKAPAEVIEWPLPWARGVSLDYDDTSERITEVKGVGNRVVTTGVTRIRVIGEAAHGFVQSWTTLHSDTRYEKVSDTGQLMLQELTASMGGMPLEVRLATDGTYAASPTWMRSTAFGAVANRSSSASRNGGSQDRRGARRPANVLIF